MRARDQPCSSRVTVAFVRTMSNLVVFVGGALVRGCNVLFVKKTVYFFFLGCFRSSPC